MSGSTIGGIAGAFIGGFIGGPMGAQIGFAAGSLVGGYIDPEKIQGPRLGEMPVQLSQEGAPRPIVFGTPEPFAGNLMAAGPPIIINVEEQQGKGGGPVVESQKVFKTYAVRICEGRPEGVVCLKAWRDGKLVRDMTGQSVIAAENLIFASKATFYPGDENQLPSPVIESLPVENGGGVGNVPAHRGTAYMDVLNDDLTGTGGRIPNYTFLMSSSSTIAENCEEAGLRFHFPLNGVSPGGVSQEVVAGRNGFYSGYNGDIQTAVNGQNMNVGGIGSVEFTQLYGYTAAFVSEDDDEDNPFAFQNDPQWTVSCWFEVVEDEPRGTEMVNIATHWGAPLSGGTIWSFRLMPVGAEESVMVFRTTELSGTHTDLIGPSVSSGRAHFVLATYNEDIDGGTLRLYFDGLRVDSRNNMAGKFTQGGENMIEVGGGYYYPLSYGGLIRVQDVKGYNLHMDDQDVVNRYLTDDGSVREAPDAPGVYVFPNGQTVSICSPSASTGLVLLSDILLEIGQRCGISADQMDVTEAEDVEVEGFLVARPMQAQAAISPLMLAYFSDFPEYDLKIRWTPRGGAIVETFTDDDWIDENPDDAWKFGQQVELPRKVNLFFCDKNANYARVPVPAERESISIASQSIFEVELPLVLDRDAAQQKAWIILKVMWEESQGELVREIPTYRYAHLVASNPISYGGKRWRIDRLEPTDGVTKMTAKRDRASNYQSDAVAGSVLDPTAPVSNLKGPTHLQALNLPQMLSQWNQPGMVLAATGVTQAWPGAQIYMSVDGGATEQLVATISSRATMGRLVYSIDEDEEPITVDVWDGRQLSTISDAEIAARHNGFAITTDGVSEVGQFQVVTEDSNGYTDLTTVTRGMEGTEAVSHVSGDDFLLLDGALYFLPIDSSHIGKTIRFRAVTRGTPIENNPYIEVVFAPLFTGPPDVAYLLTESGNPLLAEDGGYLQTE